MKKIKLTNKELIISRDEKYKLDDYLGYGYVRDKCFLIFRGDNNTTIEVFIPHSIFGKILERLEKLYPSDPFSVSWIDSKYIIYKNDVKHYGKPVQKGIYEKG